MSRQESESVKPRQRSNTTSFAASFSNWRKRSDQQTGPTPPTPPTNALSPAALIEALTPPAVPSLAHARSLAGILSTLSPIPPCELLNPILAQLCTATAPTSIQAAGYDILSSYLENHEAASLTTAERLSFLALFIESSPTWGQEIWEPKFKSLRSLTKYGTEIEGVEDSLIAILKSWIHGAFQPFIDHKTIDRAERAERERSVDVIVKFFDDTLQNPGNISRITVGSMADVLQFYADLVDQLVGSNMADPQVTTPTSPPTLVHSKSSANHRRTLSSLSSSSSPSTSLPAPTPTVKHPADMAIELYLQCLSSQLKTLPPSYLRRIFPVLFRAVAFSASPLPRLGHPTRREPRKKQMLEDKVVETINALLSGPYATLCMRILKFYLFPLDSVPDALSSSFANSEALGQSPNRVHSPLALLTSLGAHRTLRNYVRRALSARLARAYISREMSMSYSPSGIPANMDYESDVMDKAWPKEDYSVGTGGNGWDAGRLGKVLAESVKAWVGYSPLAPSAGDSPSVKDIERRDEILEEAAGLLKDIFQEIDLREDDQAMMDEEETYVVGSTLYNLSEYVIPLRNPDGTPFVIPIKHPSDAPTPILRTISSLLARDHSRPLSPLLSTTLVHVAEHLTDDDTASLPFLMMEQHDLSPTSPEWLRNWKHLFSSPMILTSERPCTRRAVMDALRATYDSVKDMTPYRRPLGDLVCEFCDDLRAGTTMCDDADVMWKMIGEEVVLRCTEQPADDPGVVAQLTRFLDLLSAVATAAPEEGEGDNNDASSTYTTDTQSPGTTTTTSPTAVSPAVSRGQSDYINQSPREPKEPAATHSVSMMSILQSLAGGTPSRSQSAHHSQSPEELKVDPVIPPLPGPPPVPREVSAASALVEIFAQCVFTPLSLEAKNIHLAVRVFDMLLNVISHARSSRAKLAALQFLMRVRVDRDHRLYFVSGDSYDPNGQIRSLAVMINRIPGGHTHSRSSDDPGESGEPRKPRSRAPPDPGRQLTRGRKVGENSNSAPSRSRSRTTAPPPPPPLPPRQVDPLWQIPETLPFNISGSDSPSEVLVSYDPEGPNRIPVLPISQYLRTLILSLEKETDWEVLSYILCHLSVQLANKHLFCGPNSRVGIARLVSLLCSGLLSGTFASQAEQFPTGLKLRDAHGLAYQILSVLVSYRRCFDNIQQRHLIVEVFQAGLNGQLSTIKCCLHALTLSAFELPTSMTKFLSRILEKLSQIMSNPSMAVHILAFLSIIGSLSTLHANFTEGDFKVVFGVALQYLQHYNRRQATPTISWALSQHVRILSYSAVYVWFLALKLPDRPRHIQYITRQLLLANEGNTQVDAPTEVCFDWLARYTYASADPRPANSLFSEIILHSPNSSANEKTWVMGNAVVTIRALERTGWVEALVRRPSGLSKFVCRVENVPMVGPGDVHPDLLSITAGLIMERNPSHVSATVEDGESVPIPNAEEITNSSLSNINSANDENLPLPDPITGYVWSKTAPSQRRKQVSIDPSFLLLQLSPIPDGATEPFVKRIVDQASLPRFLSSLDRIPVIDTHKVGILYVAPGQTKEGDILLNTHGSPAYTRFLEGLGRLINLRGQVDVYAGGLDPDEDGEYAYAWWDDIRQILYHTATMMPSHPHDPFSNYKKRHIGNDYVRIVWNDSGRPYIFDTLTTQFQFVNIVIEPHSIGPIAAFSNNLHENEFFKLTLQLAPGMTEFAPIGHFKLISAENLPLLVRQLSLLSDWFASVFAHTQNDTLRVEKKTNWHERLDAIRRFKIQLPQEAVSADAADGVIGQEALRDFTTSF